MGKPKYIETPEILWQHFLDYKKWAKDNPLKKHDFVGQTAEEVYREIERPLTWWSFESWLKTNGIVCHLGSYEQNAGEAYTAYLPIIRDIKAHIRGEQLEGGMAGIYNANLTARINGLTEKTESKNETKVDGTIKISLDLGDAK